MTDRTLTLAIIGGGRSGPALATRHAFVAQQGLLPQPLDRR